MSQDESLANSNEIDAICDQFEKEWLAGQSPQIEDVLARHSEVDQSRLLRELLLIEVEIRRRRGEAITAADYSSRFPDQTDLLDTAPSKIVSGSAAQSDTVDVSVSPSDETRLPPGSADAPTLAPNSGTTPEHAPAQDTVGKRFGDYELLHEIARGGMGVVYKARQISLNRMVALKMIRSGELAGEDEIQRFHTEAEAAAQLDHPNIVPIHEVGEQNGLHFFSMGFVDGQGLDARLKEGPLPPREAAELIKTIAEAIQYAHDKGIVHRDLKPANALIDADGKPRITDFGLAKNIAGDSGVTATGQVLGTPSYMPPEQASGKTEQIGPLADVYSLGAMLYALLTGRPPFQAANVMDTLIQVLEQEPLAPRKLNSVIPRDLETICLKCLRKEQQRRYATVQEFADDLGRWLENKPIVARRVSVIEKAWLWCKRKPVIVGSAASVLFVIGLSSYLINKNNRQAAEENNRTRAAELVVGLKKADIEQVPTAIAQLKDFRQWADPILKQQIAESRDDSGEKLRLSLALLPVDESQVGYLQSELLKATPAALPVIRDALKPHRDRIVKPLWAVLDDDQRETKARFNAACTLATYDAANKTQWKPVLPFVAEQLVESIQSSFGDAGRFQTMLKPIRAQLAKPVSLIVRDTSKTDLQRDIALATVLEFAHDAPQQLADVLASSEQRQFARTFDKLATQKTAAVKHLTAILKELWEEETPEPEKERIAKRQANAAVALVKLGHSAPVWPLLKSSPDPRLRSYVIHWAEPLGVDPEMLITRFENEPDDAIRRALLLALGEYSLEQLSIQRRKSLFKRIQTIFESDPDPGLHGCARWVLRKWEHEIGICVAAVGSHGHGSLQRLAGLDVTIQELTMKLRANESQRKQQVKDGNRSWYVTTQGHTMVVINAGDVLVGSSKTEPGRGDEEYPSHLRQINRTFAISAHEVTREQYVRYLKERQAEILRRRKIPKGTSVYEASPSTYVAMIRKYATTHDSPAVVLSWYNAAAYCNWLSKKEGIPEEHWCYEKNAEGTFASGMKAKSNYLHLNGYRLPTEAEWEYACRAGTITSRYYGVAISLLPQYAWYRNNSDGVTAPTGLLKPNEFGLFDMLGNAYEWCHDRYWYGYDRKFPRQAVPENVDPGPMTDGPLRLLRGGSFAYGSSHIRSAKRGNTRPMLQSADMGFRPIRSLIFKE